jgi:outer membrane receptor protein involved in Fe transport
MLAYTIKFSGTRVTFRLNVDNIFDKIYLSESADDLQYDPTVTSRPNDYEIGKGGSAYNRVYTGFGRTWTLGAKVNF